MIKELGFARYVRSFTEGRVRLRHPALEHVDVATRARESLLQVLGVNEVEINCQTGSALLLYDPTLISQDVLIEKGMIWASWLDDCLKTDEVPAAPVMG